MALESTKTQVSARHYPVFNVKEVQDEAILENICSIVTQWLKECEDRLKKCEDSNFSYSSANFGPPIKEEFQYLKDYRSTAINIECDLGLVIRALKLGQKLSDYFKSNRIFAVYDEKATLQGIAFVLFKHSRKQHTPVVKIENLLTAFWNMPLNDPKNPQRVRGAGCALLAKAIVIEPRNKNVILQPLTSSKAFYEKIGFVPTKKQSWSVSLYKLEKVCFLQFIKKWAPNMVFSSEQSSQAKTSETGTKKEECKY